MGFKLRRCLHTRTHGIVLRGVRSDYDLWPLAGFGSQVRAAFVLFRLLWTLEAKRECEGCSVGSDRDAHEDCTPYGGTLSAVQEEVRCALPCCAAAKRDHVDLAHASCFSFICRYGLMLCLFPSCFVVKRFDRQIALLSSPGFHCYGG